MPTHAQTMLTAYQEARLEGSKNFDQKKLAAHWLAKQDWFSDQLARTCQIEADLKIIRVPVSEASEALMRIIEVCQKHCELYL
jgi:hypothetical protein